MLETIWSCGYVISGENFKTTSRSNIRPEFVYICTILYQEYMYVKKILLHNRNLISQAVQTTYGQFALSFFPLSFGVSLSF